jgi:predicted NBD/HSP70 family sugar kinase
MNDSSVYQSDLLNAETAPAAAAAAAAAATAAPNIARKGNLLLRLILAAQPISRTEIASRLGIDKSTVTDNVKPLIAKGLLREETLDTDVPKGRKPRVLSFVDDNDYFIGVNLGVRTSQVGLTTLKGEILSEDDFATPPQPEAALRLTREKIENLIRENSGKKLRVIGVSVPGLTDTERRTLVYAPNLSWRSVDVAEAFGVSPGVKVVVENDATAAAMYEARMRIRQSAASDPLMTNFILVRSGTGIGVGLVIGGEVFRGTGLGRGIAGEFGHMTIVAGGKPCVCGNRGCWEKYASAASAASLYLGDRPLRPHETMPRFVEIVAKAENGDIRSKTTLEKIGDYLGIGIANVIMGVGIPRVIISGRLVYGWRFIEKPLKKAIERSIVGKLDGWSIEAGEPQGAALGGALEVAIEEYLARGFAA